MARNTEFYKGRRKRRSAILIPTAIVLGIISLIVVLFYGMQKYVVITKDEVTVKLPLLAGGDNPILAATDGTQSFEAVTANLVFDPPDYSGVETIVDGDVGPMRAIFVQARDINKDKIIEYADRLIRGNALVLEMKPTTGLLMWDSQASAAISFGLTGSPLPNDVKETLKRLHDEEGVYLVAQIHVCRDDLYASRSTTVTLLNEYGGNYSDAGGPWLDAYSLDVRRYTVELVRELYDMGFDEVVLASVRHPAPEENVKLSYTRDMSTTPGAVNAVCGFAVYVAEELADREGKLSIYVDSAQSLVRPDPNTGQDARLFLRLYDRVYYNTDRYAYTFNIDDIRSGVTVGRDIDRFVPVVINYLPDNSTEVSWVLIDQEEN